MSGEELKAAFSLNGLTSVLNTRGWTFCLGVCLQDQHLLRDICFQWKLTQKIQITKAHNVQRGGWIGVSKSADPLKLMAESVDPLKNSTKSESANCLSRSGHPILGDPGAVSGGGKIFSSAGFSSRPFRLFPAPTIKCPWVSEEDDTRDTKPLQLLELPCAILYNQRLYRNKILQMREKEKANMWTMLYSVSELY